MAPEVFHSQLLADYKNVKHVSLTGHIFPSIYELSPDVIVFDYEFMGNEMEKTLRRITANKFYNKIKICCFKNTSNEKTDSFLKAIGVDHFVYKSEPLESKQSKLILNTLNSIIDASVVKWMINVTQ